MVNFENYEEYMLLFADNELTQAEQEDLAQFMAAHPELEAELTVFETLRLKPDTTQVFEHKEALLKQPAIIPLRRFALYAASAASVALLVTLGLKYNNRSVNRAVIVNHSQPAINTQPASAISNKVEPAKPIIEQQAIAKVDRPVAKPRVVLPARNTTTATGNVQKTPVVKDEVVTIAYQQPAADTVKQPKREEEDTYIAIVDTESPEPLQQKKSGLLTEILADKTGGINEIGRAMSAKLDKAREIKNKIKDTDISVKIGDKQLFVVKF